MISLQNLHIDSKTCEIYLLVDVWANTDGPLLFACFGGHRKCSIGWVIMLWFQVVGRHLLQQFCSGFNVLKLENTDISHKKREVRLGLFFSFSFLLFSWMKTLYFNTNFFIPSVHWNIVSTSMVNVWNLTCDRPLTWTSDNQNDRATMLLVMHICIKRHVWCQAITSTKMTQIAYANSIE